MKVLRTSARALTTLMCSLAIACGGEDGMDGAAGAAGMDGTNGSNGTNGMNGTDGEPGTDGGEGMDGMDGMDGAPGFPREVLYLSNNGPANAGTVERLTQSFATTRTVEPGNNEGIDFTRTGDLVQAGDRATGASLRTFCSVGRRADGATFDDGTTDHEIAGAATTLVNPKGFEIAHRAGYLLVANFMDMSVKVFGTAAAGDVAPVATTTLTGNPWDLTYDETNDRLFVALTNGTVAVFDQYIGGDFAGTADRTINVVDAAGAGLSVNLHGIAYDRDTDTLVVSDVGDAASAEDGAIFVIDGASTADGDVVPMRSIAGAATLLGNPVDIILSGADLRVAEKANDRLLVFADIFGGASGDIAPDFAVESTRPEALTHYDVPNAHPGVTDIDDSGIVVPYITVTSNPGAGMPTTGAMVRLSAALNAEVGEFDAARGLENVTFDANGDAYATFDVGGAMPSGGILIVNRAATSRDDETFSASRDREITGAATGLVAPKGIDVASSMGWVFVAEFNATTPAVLVFSSCASGNAAPLATVDTAGARPWDMDYDVATDKLYAAFTNGTIGVYDQFSVGMGASGPDRLITPADGGVDVSVNIHGIDYDPGTDSLLLSDVGSAADPDDGQLFVVPGASTASGSVQVAVRIAGPDSMLGNPVDIAYDGADLYVAEKSNNVIMRFDDILESASGDIAADASIAFTRPESVALNPGYFRSR